MYNRRQFLAYALQFAVLPRALREFAGESGKSATANGFSASDREILAAAMDVIIPAGNYMPSASMVGGVTYLQFLVWRYPSIGDRIRQFLKELTQGSANQSRRKFVEMHFDQRVQVLNAIEKADANAFGNFVRSVYESYYANPRVLGMIWCPSVAPSAEDIEGLLEPVRKLRRLYREEP